MATFAGIMCGMAVFAVYTLHRGLSLILEEIRDLRLLLEKRLPLSELERIRQHVPDDDD
jgi:hypothetical protein